MNCPHCGSPVPLGSDFCFDCGARMPAAEHDPWDYGEESHIRRNTGERSYASDQRRQALHEFLHEKHSGSAEAENSDYEHASRHPSPVRPQPAPARARQAGTAGNRKKSNNTGLLVPIIIFIIIMLYSCAAEL